MNKKEYLWAGAPAILVTLIILLAVVIDKVGECTMFSLYRNPCTLYGVNLMWFADLAFFTVLLGWIFVISSIMKIAKLLGRDLPKPWGKNKT